MMESRCISAAKSLFFLFQVLYADTFSALHELLCSVLARDLSPDGIQTMFKVTFCTHCPQTLSSLKLIKASFLNALFFPPAYRELVELQTGP